MSDVALQYMQPMWIAAMRHRGIHNPGLTDATWQDLIVWASPRKLLSRSLDARGVGLLWDDPRQFAPSDRRYDVGVPIEREDALSVEAPGFVLVTAPGRYLKITHEGSYDRIDSTYADVFDGAMRYEGWVLFAQPIIEVYRNSPSEVPSEKLRTDIYIPAAKL